MSFPSFANPIGAARRAQADQFRRVVANPFRAKEAQP